MRASAGAGALAVMLAFSLAGCAAPDASTAGEVAAADPGDGRAASQEAEAHAGLDGLDLEFSKRDTDASYDVDAACTITLADAGVQVQGNGAQADGTAVTISAGGTYVISGTVQQGSIVVDAGDEDAVQLVLDGASIHNEVGPALFVANADACALTLAEGSENALSDGAAYQLEGEDDKRDAVIFSKDDLIINGSGSLAVTASCKHAICSNDDLVITGGTFAVTAVQDAFRGKDCIKIAGGSFVVEAGDDAFHSDAFFYAKDGTVAVESCYEGYEGEQVIIDGGDHTITAQDDALNAALSDDDADADVADAGEAAQVADGGDAGMDALGSFAGVPEGGSPAPPASAPEEGGGWTPGALGEDAGQAPGAPPDAQGAPGGSGSGFDGGQMAASSSDCLIQINGGTLRLTAGSDGVDSNGLVQINGGTVLVSGPDAGMDGALDYDISAEVTGGTILMMGSVGNTQGLDASTQPVVYASVAGTAGQEVQLLDEQGAVLASFVAGADFSTVFASSPQIADGQACSVQVGDTSTGLVMGDMLDAAQAAGMGKGRAPQVASQGEQGPGRSAGEA